MESISIVIPIFNSANTIASTLDSIELALKNSGITAHEVIVVDDGSSDNLFEILEDYRSEHVLNIRLIVQTNLGRVVARKTGLDNSSFENIVYIDSRVIMQPKSLSYLSNFLDENLDCNCVIGNISYADGLPHVSYFWEGLERLAWHRFHKVTGDIELHNTNFNQIPKGTTLIYFRRMELKRVYSVLSNEVNLNQTTNDDTMLIKEFIKKERAFVVRKFEATYFPRTQFVSFLKHAFSRGGIARDGYFGPENKARYYALTIVFMSVLIMLATTVINPKLLLVEYLAVVGFTILLSMVRRIPKRATVSLVIYAPVFTLAYLAGIVKAQSKMFFTRDPL